MSKKTQFIAEYKDLCRRYGAIIGQVYREGAYSPHCVLRVKPSDLERALEQIGIECQMEPTCKLDWPA